MNLQLSQFHTSDLPSIMMGYFCLVNDLQLELSVMMKELSYSCLRSRAKISQS